DCYVLLTDGGLCVPRLVLLERVRRARAPDRARDVEGRWAHADAAVVDPRDQQIAQIEADPAERRVARVHEALGEVPAARLAAEIGERLTARVGQRELREHRVHR